MITREGLYAYDYIFGGVIIVRVEDASFRIKINMGNRKDIMYSVADTGLFDRSCLYWNDLCSDSTAHYFGHYSADWFIST
jgi:hypothetical protein